MTEVKRLLISGVAREVKPRELAAEYGATLYPFFFQGLAAGKSDPAALQPFMQADAIHPNAEGVARIVADLGPAVQAFLVADHP